MECSCLRHSDLPGTSRLFTDLIYHYDRVKDLYPHPPNEVKSLVAASRFEFPDARRAALVEAMKPLNEGNPSLALLAQPGTVVVVTGQQVGLFSGPAYSIYKALTAIKNARALSELGIPAVPVFWLATEDHDFAEVNHVWVFDAKNRPVKIEMNGCENSGQRPVGGIALCDDIPTAQLRAALEGLPFAEEAVAIVERAYRPGETMGSAFANLIKELFAKYGLLLVDPLNPLLREIAAPLMREAVEQMPELTDALIARSRELVERGYHAQVLVDKHSSLVFLLQDGKRLALRRTNGDFVAQHLKLSTAELAARGTDLSPNALLRPVMQDYLLPSAAYIGGPAELAYLAQSQLLYGKLLGRQPAAFPRAGFTLVDERSRQRMQRYGLEPKDLMTGEQELHDAIAGRLVPESLRKSLDRTRTSFHQSLDALSDELRGFDITLAAALETSRRKIEYQVGKISRKTANQMMVRDEQATRDALSLGGLVFPEKHLQERLYSIIPFIAKFGPRLIDDLYSAVQVECPDHQFAVV
jgi:bacillithiol biosynthesis cysteine-adding enzyme BshC